MGKLHTKQLANIVLQFSFECYFFFTVYSFDTRKARAWFDLSYVLWKSGFCLLSLHLFSTLLSLSTHTTHAPSAHFFFSRGIHLWFPLEWRTQTYQYALIVHVYEWFLSTGAWGLCFHPAFPPWWYPSMLAVGRWHIQMPLPHISFMLIGLDLLLVFH